jgi:hypothetical protein
LAALLAEMTLLWASDIENSGGCRFASLIGLGGSGPRGMLLAGEAPSDLEVDVLQLVFEHERGRPANDNECLCTLGRIGKRRERRQRPHYAGSLCIRVHSPMQALDRNIDQRGPAVVIRRTVGMDIAENGESSSRVREDCPLLRRSALRVNRWRHPQGAASDADSYAALRRR